MSMISEQVKRLRKLANQWKHNDVAGCDLIFEAADTIEALSAKVRAADKPKTGKWVEAVKDGVLSYTDVYAMCDQCHKVKFNGWGMNYCPNCGAKMR